MDRNSYGTLFGTLKKRLAAIREKCLLHDASR